MTDYNLMTSFIDMVGLLNQALLGYVSVLFAFLIAGYFIADKLKPSMIVLIIVLFTAVAGDLLGQVYFIQHDMGVITTEMALRVANNEFALPHLSMTYNPGIYFFITQGIATIGGYIGALIFFFHQRREGLKTSRPYGRVAAKVRSWHKADIRRGQI